MKFLLDVCAASRSMHSMLTEEGHDVLSALEGNLEGHPTKSCLPWQLRDDGYWSPKIRTSASWCLCAGCPTRASFASSRCLWRRKWRPCGS